MANVNYVSTYVDTYLWLSTVSVTFGLRWVIEAPPRGDPRPPPRISGRGRGGESILAAGEGRGQSLYSPAGTGRGGDRICSPRRGRGGAGTEFTP